MFCCWHHRLLFVVFVSDPIRFTIRKYKSHAHTHRIRDIASIVRIVYRIGSYHDRSGFYLVKQNTTVVNFSVAAKSNEVEEEEEEDDEAIAALCVS